MIIGTYFVYKIPYQQHLRKLKHLFQDLSYNFNQKRSAILIDKSLDNKFSSFFIKNGYLEKIENNDENKFQVNSLDKEIKLFEEQFINYQDSFKKDYLVDLNSVLLNNLLQAMNLG